MHRKGSIFNNALKVNKYRSTYQHDRGCGEVEETGFDPLRGDSMFTLLRPEEFFSVKDKIFNFLRVVLDDDHGIDVIVAAERKGMRVLKDFCRESRKDVTIVSDHDLDEEPLDDRNVLVFDDSVHTGGKVISLIGSVLAKDPRSIHLACIMMNEKARNNIRSAYRDLDAKCCMDVFNDHDEQYLIYQRWFMTYLSGIIIKGNSDYPILNLEMEGVTLERARRSFSEFAGSTCHVLEEYDVDSLSDMRGCTSWAYLLNHNGGRVPAEFKGLIEDDLAKVRCLVIEEDGLVDLHIVPMISPRHIGEGCPGVEEDGRCLKKNDPGLNPELVCDACIIRTLNIHYLELAEKCLRKKIEEGGGRIISHRLFEPSLSRYLGGSNL